MAIKKETSGISFFNKYLTVWVILCMAAGVLIGKYLSAIPEFLGRFEYAKLLQKSEMRKDIVIELSYKGFG